MRTLKKDEHDLVVGGLQPLTISIDDDDVKRPGRVEVPIIVDPSPIPPPPAVPAGPGKEPVRQKPPIPGTIDFGG